MEAITLFDFINQVWQDYHIFINIDGIDSFENLKRFLPPKSNPTISLETAFAFVDLAKNYSTGTIFQDSNLTNVDLDTDVPALFFLPAKVSKTKAWIVKFYPGPQK